MHCLEISSPNLVLVYQFPETELMQIKTVMDSNRHFLNIKKSVYQNWNSDNSNYFVNFKLLVLFETREYHQTCGLTYRYDM